jgi:hypothetical protein
MSLPWKKAAELARESTPAVELLVTPPPPAGATPAALPVRDRFPKRLGWPLLP